MCWWQQHGNNGHFEEVSDGSGDTRENVILINFCWGLHSGDETQVCLHQDKHSTTKLYLQAGQLLYFLVWGRVSVSCSGQLWTHCVAQVGPVLHFDFTFPNSWDVRPSPAARRYLQSSGKDSTELCCVVMLNGVEDFCVISCSIFEKNYINFWSCITVSLGYR